MDDTPVDWEKEKRIKAEREKASRQILTEDKSKLAYIDPETFAVKKGFTRDPEGHRVMAEKLSGISLAVIFFGSILDVIFVFITANLHMGLANMIPAIIEGIIFSLLIMLPIFGSLIASAEIIAYFVKTKKILTVQIINVVITIIIFVALLKIRELILILGF